MGKEIVCYSEKRFFECHEDTKSVSLRASSGSYGGGSEVLVCWSSYKDVDKLERRTYLSDTHKE